MLDINGLQSASLLLRPG
jgi:hypothetical protein